MWAGVPAADGKKGGQSSSSKGKGSPTRKKGPKATATNPLRKIDDDDDETSSGESAGAAVGADAVAVVGPFEAHSGISPLDLPPCCFSGGGAERQQQQLLQQQKQGKAADDRSSDGGGGDKAAAAAVKGAGAAEGLGSTAPASSPVYCQELLAPIPAGTGQRFRQLRAEWLKDQGEVEEFLADD